MRAISIYWSFPWLSKWTMETHREYFKLFIICQTTFYSYISCDLQLLPTKTRYMISHCFLYACRRQTNECIYLPPIGSMLHDTCACRWEEKRFYSAHIWTCNLIRANLHVLSRNLFSLNVLSLTSFRANLISESFKKHHQMPGSKITLHSLFAVSFIVSSVLLHSYTRFEFVSCRSWISQRCGVVEHLNKVVVPKFIKYVLKIYRAVDVVPSALWLAFGLVKCCVQKLYVYANFQ